MTGYEIRSALRAGQRVFSTQVTSPSPLWPQIIKRSGVDFVFIDSEHIPLGRELLSWMCQTYAAMGIPPVVRIPFPDEYEAAKVLDAGAQGVIGPYVETAEQVRRLAGAARWRPLKGQRLETALDNPDALEPRLRQYLEDRNRHTLLMINIESTPAIENLDAILSVPGLDAIFIGTHDLSCSLGIPEQYRHPRFQAAVHTIFRKAREHGVGAGIHYWEDLEHEIEWARAGGNLVMHSSDVMLYGETLNRDLQELRRALDAGPSSEGRPTHKPVVATRGA